MVGAHALCSWPFSQRPKERVSTRKRREPMLRSAGPVAICFSLLLLPATLLAQPPAAKPEGGAPAPAGPPPPAPELEAFMKGFDGAWKCESKFFAGAFGPNSPEVMGKSTVRFKKDLDGHFWRGEYEMKKSKTNPAMKGIFYVGYDIGAKKFVLTGLDNGGGFGTGSGTVEGDTVTFLGETTFGGMKMKTRETMGKRGPKEGFHKIETDMGSGFTPMAEDTCKK
jgi:hypothetical protein